MFMKLNAMFTTLLSRVMISSSNKDFVFFPVVLQQLALFVYLQTQSFATVMKALYTVGSEIDHSVILAASLPYKHRYLVLFIQGNTLLQYWPFGYPKESFLIPRNVS